MSQNPSASQKHANNRQQILSSLQNPLIQYLLMFLVVLCVYVPTFWFTYVWDDWSFIVQNQSIREWKNIPSFFTDPNTFTQDPLKEGLDAWRPARNLYFLVTYKLHGLHPAGWHFHHVLLHCLVSTMLLLFFHRLYRYAAALPSDKLLSPAVQIATWFAVVAWAVHPANLEVTAWLKCADDLLACLFSLWALIVLFPVTKSVTNPRAVLASFLFTVALLSKESVAPIPMIYVVIVALSTPDRRRTLRHLSTWLAAFLLFVALAVYTIIRTSLLGKLEQAPYLAGSFSLMMATMTGAVVRYLQLTFWPFWPTVQVNDYFGWVNAQSWTQPEVILDLVILATVLVVIVFISRRNLLFLTGWLFAALAFTPVANIVPMVQVMAERFMYFPMMGIALCVSALYATWLRRGNLKIRALLPFAAAIALGVTTCMRMPTWIDEQNFNAHNVDARPDNYRANLQHGNRLRLAGQKTQALRYYELAMQQRPNLETGMAISRLLIELDDTPSAIDYLARVMSGFPQSPRPYALKAYILGTEKKTTALLELYDKALKMTPDVGIIHYYKAGVYQELGRTTEALESLRVAVRQDPKLTSASESLKHLQSLIKGNTVPVISGKPLTQTLKPETHPQLLH